MRWLGRKFKHAPGRCSLRRGQSLVEFAIVLPLLMLIVFGVLDLGRAFFALVTITNAAREGARFGVTNINLSDGMSISERDQIEAATRDEIVAGGTGIDRAEVDVIPSCPSLSGNCGSGVPLQVTVRYPYNSIINTVFFGVLFPGNINMERSIEMEIP